MQRIILDQLGSRPLDAQARSELRSAFKLARRGAEVLVLTGAPGSWNHARAAGDARAAHGEFHSLALAVISHPAPVIAAVSGEVTGFGVALAAAADLRLASADASFRIAGAASALETGAYRLLVQALGRARADDLAYTCRALSAEAAAAEGFVSGPYGAPSDAETLADALSTPGASALKRAATSGLVSRLTEELAYDAWLALTAAGETP